uniref:Uncharacterized protein n=1 Tax=Romanomermis culicivorax TaxID=13658 RepID=A0A915HVV6_ROMCU
MKRLRLISQSKIPGTTNIEGGLLMHVQKEYSKFLTRLVKYYYQLLTSPRHEEVSQKVSFLSRLFHCIKNKTEIIDALNIVDNINLSSMVWEVMTPVVKQGMKDHKGILYHYNTKPFMYFTAYLHHHLNDARINIMDLTGHFRMLLISKDQSVANQEPGASVLINPKNIGWLFLNREKEFEEVKQGENKESDDDMVNYPIDLK